MESPFKDSLLLPPVVGELTPTSAAFHLVLCRDPSEQYHSSQWNEPLVQEQRKVLTKDWRGADRLELQRTRPPRERPRGLLCKAGIPSARQDTVAQLCSSGPRSQRDDSVSVQGPLLPSWICTCPVSCVGEGLGLRPLHVAPYEQVQPG